MLWLVALGLSAAACGQEAAAPSAPLSPPRGAPEPPELGALQQLVLRGQPQRVIVHDGVAYAADIDGLSTYALDGWRIAVDRHVATPGCASDVALFDGMLYVADGDAGVAVFAIDHAEPSGAGPPRLIRREATPHPARRVVAGAPGVAVLEDHGGVTLLRPDRAAEQLALPGDPRDAAWLGSRLYIADTGDGLVRVALEPAAHVELRDHSFRRAISLASRGTALLVGSRDQRVTLLETAPELRALAEVTLEHGPARLDVLGSRVIAAGGARDPGDFATVLEVGPGSLSVRSRLPFTVLSAAADEHDGILAARGGDGLAVVRAGAIAAAVPGGRFDRVIAGEDRVVAWGEDGSGVVWPGTDHATELAAPVRDAVMCGDALCTLDPQGELCARGSDRTRRTERCARVPGATALAWQASSGLVWVLDDTGALHGFDPASAVRRATVARPAVASHEQPARLVIDGDRAVALDVLLGVLHGFQLAGEPRYAGRYLLHARPAAVAVSDGVALVAEPSAGLQIVDVRDPDRPHELAWLPLDRGPEGVAVWRAGGERRVALAHGEHGVSLWAWDGAAALRLLARTDTSGLASDVALARGALWIADGVGMARIALAEEGR